MTRPTTTGKAQDLITFTRSTTGTALAKISYGEELVTNGDFSSDSDWQKGSNTTIVNGEAVFNGALSYVYQNAVTVGKLYFCSVTVNTWNSGAALSVGSSATGAGTIYSNIERVSNTTTEFYFTAQTTTLGIGSRSFNVDGSIDNISVKEVLYDQPDGTLQLFNHPINKPRIEYDAEGNCLGLLVEEARTNVVPYSDLSAHWNWVNTTDIGGAATAPDGTQTATLMRENTAGTAHIAFAAIVSSSTSTTASIFAKAGGRRYLQLSASTNQNSWAMFDLEQGVVTEQKSSGITATIEPYGNGWYRCKAALTLSASGSTTNFVWGSSILATTNGIRNVYHGDGTSGIYLWGAQVETGSFPTSYIPTSGSTVTRSTDVASLAVSEFGYNQDQGTVVAEAAPSDISSGGRVFSLNDGTGSNVMRSQAQNSNHFIVISGGAVQGNIDAGTFANNTFSTLSGAYKQNDIAACIDGGAVVTDTSATIPTITNLSIGQRYDGNNKINGHIKSIQYYPLRLSNAQLQALTV